MTLKKLPCVSFAGVDSLDDVKNHTYNELFVSGGFIVSDESILNPEVITIGKIYCLKHVTSVFSGFSHKWPTRTFFMYCPFCQPGNFHHFLECLLLHISLPFFYSVNNFL